MQVKEVLQAWGKILSCRPPALSLEITRECPLHCPGCYAYEDDHLGGGVTLRELADRKGIDLIEGVLQLVDEWHPLHLSIVGGDPLVRYRELDALLPQLIARGIFVQIVTSAFRPIPASWATLPRLNVVVSIDGLQPEHDARRKPATYDRIFHSITGHQVIVHCTITGQMMKRPDYLEEFVHFWSARDEVRKIWMSLFTPQVGADAPECLSPAERDAAINVLLRLRELYPKLDMPRALIMEFARPPETPQDCIFARTTLAISADLKTKITPCQFGGNPDCSRCGCMASMGLAAVGHHQLVPGITAGDVFQASARFGEFVSKFHRNGTC